MDISSFTAASTLPKKLICNEELIGNIKNNNIIPKHIQINPTNKCPLKCSFCSCKNRDKEAEMSLDFMIHLLKRFFILGTEAVTITGGGDPLAYPYLKNLLEYCKRFDVKTGLVTNGILFNTIDKNILKSLTWCRISVSNEQLLADKAISNVLNKEVGWAFSYVLNGETNWKNLIDCINFANEHNFTHIRLVDDILNENQNNIEGVKKGIKDKGINDKLVIYQGRKTYTKGNKRCLISLLKPNIDPKGNMLPCCGIQYAFENPALDFDKNAIMNLDRTIEEIYREQLYFDGSKCVKCYYSDYNDIMNIIWDGNKIEHKEFI